MGNVVAIVGTALGTEPMRSFIYFNHIMIPLSLRRLSRSLEWDLKHSLDLWAWQDRIGLSRESL